jgi:hypothetical protein
VGDLHESNQAFCMLIVVRGDERRYRALQGRAGELAREAERAALRIGAIGPWLAADLERRGIEQITAASGTGDIDRIMMYLLDHWLWLVPGTNAVGEIRCEQEVCAPPPDWAADPVETVIAHVFPSFADQTALFLAATGKPARSRPRLSGTP